MADSCPGIVDFTAAIFPPNPFPVPAGGTAQIRTARAAIFTLASGGHYAGCMLTVEHGDQPNSAGRLRGWSTNGFVVVPGAGKWIIRNGGSASVVLVQVDDPCGKLKAWLYRKGYAVPVHTSPQIGTASTLVIAANIDRRYLCIEWPSARTEALFLSFGPSAVANEGIQLDPGDAYEMAGDNVWAGPINGIVATTAADVLVTEGT